MDLWFSLEYYMGVIMDLLPVVLFGGVVCILTRWRKGEKLISSRGITEVVFVCYLTGLLALTAVPANFWRHIWYTLRYHTWSGITFHFFTFRYNLIPDFWRDFGMEHVGNLLLYVPFGFFVPMLQKERRGWQVPAMGFVLCLCVEVIQLFIDRSLDANDLILNTAGAAVGYGLFLLFRAVCPNFVKKCQEIKL